MSGACAVLCAVLQGAMVLSLAPAGMPTLTFPFCIGAIIFGAVHRSFPGFTPIPLPSITVPEAHILEAREAAVSKAAALAVKRRQLLLRLRALIRAFKYIDPSCSKRGMVVRLADAREAIIRTEVNLNRPWMPDIRVEALRVMDEMAVEMRVPIELHPDAEHWQPSTNGVAPESTSDTSASVGASGVGAPGVSGAGASVGQPEGDSAVESKGPKAFSTRFQRSGTGTRSGEVVSAAGSLRRLQDLGRANDRARHPRNSHVVQGHLGIMFALPFHRLFTVQGRDGEPNAAMQVLVLYEKQIRYMLKWKVAPAALP